MSQFPQFLMEGQPIPVQPAVRNGPELNTWDGQNYQMFGDMSNTQVYYQNRRLYIANGRMLSAEELARDDFWFVPKPLREAVAADMDKPVLPPASNLFGESLRPLTPEERLDQMDSFVTGTPAQYRTYQSKGIIVKSLMD